MFCTKADADDIVQDVYIRFHPHAGKIESVEGWLVRVTTHLCIDRKRFVKLELWLKTQ